MPTPAAYALVASVKMPLGTTAFTLQCTLDAALTVVKQGYFVSLVDIDRFACTHVITCTLA